MGFINFMSNYMKRMLTSYVMLFIEVITLLKFMNTNDYVRHFDTNMKFMSNTRQISKSVSRKLVSFFLYLFRYLT